MNYHNITHDDMANGDGVRVVLWVAGCAHKCKGCHNQPTWNPNGGILFDDEAKAELFHYLEKDYIEGITFSGGDPLYSANISTITALAKEIKEKYPNKTIWSYTGYNWNDVKAYPIMKYIDVLVDGKFVESLADKNYPWAGSTNQRVINVQKSLANNTLVLHK